MIKTCFKCGATEQIIQHHINYDPEVEVDCCLSCHAVIHHNSPKITDKERYISVLSAVKRRYWRQKPIIKEENNKPLVIDNELRRQVNLLIQPRTII